MSSNEHAYYIASAYIMIDISRMFSLEDKTQLCNTRGLTVSKYDLGLVFKPIKYFISDIIIS
jgi:hypothetical protein